MDLEQWKEAALERLEKNSFVALCGIHVETLEQDHSVLRMSYRPDLANPFGLYHGGALYTLADSAAGTAVHTDGRQYLTQNSAVYFLKNVSSGDVIAEASVKYRGGTTCLAEVEIKSEEGTLLFRGEYTFFCVKKN